ncbi:MAG TPA: FliA/WhiG family RNA polymerase sigma factor [Blastocatellia bacterium]|nr:FliA/WhiG family RNA polymerase sigma factor [Blastocatellia bacterium]
MSATYASTKVPNGPPTTADRQALIEAHLPQVRYIAERLLAKLPPSVDRDDLIGAGVLGLLDAVEKYDELRGVQFKTYAETRIRGAILDSLRDLDWSSRSLRARARAIELAARKIEQEKGRMAEEEELAAALGLELSAYQALLGELRGLTLIELDNHDENSPGLSAYQVPAHPDRSPLVEYERQETREKIIAAINSLRERERQVVALYYVEELTMKETGAVLGLTESRVSQIHTQALIHLRAALAQNKQAT